MGLNLNYDRPNALGLLSHWTGQRDNFHLGAEYRSSEFRTPGEYVVTASGVLYPQQNYWLRLSGSYSVPLPNNISATLSARYQFADPDAFKLSPLTLQGDRYGVDLTVSSPLSPITTGSITAGYSNETFRQYDIASSDAGDFRLVGRLNFRPSVDTAVTTSYDTLNRDTQLSGNRNVGHGLDRWDTSVNIQHSGFDERGTGGINASYWGSKGGP